MGYSNQRITKIKKDPILELLQRAEATDVEDACVVIPAIETLTPYPNPEQTRTWIRDNLLKGVNAIIPIKGINDFAAYTADTYDFGYDSQAIQYTTILDGLPLNTYSHKIMSKELSGNIGTSQIPVYHYDMIVKPGLMLSNLSCPVSFEAGGGSFLRQANSQNTEIVSNSTYNCRNFTSYYHGHYAYTFLQRGIYHRVAGSTHNNNDSYMLHWSPMPNSSTTYEGMLIPGTQFRNSYTNYMTICMPVNLNMKNYSYGKSKEVEFTHVDNNTNNTISTTNYNGKIVGVDWSFEFTITGNHAGSGSNWGENPTTGPNSSNGICVNGQFVYTDVLGNPCTQLIVDWCQQTIQAGFNSNNPNTTQPIKSEQGYWSKSANACCVDFTQSMPSCPSCSPRNTAYSRTFTRSFPPTGYNYQGAYVYTHRKKETDPRDYDEVYFYTTSPITFRNATSPNNCNYSNPCGPSSSVNALSLTMFYANFDTSEPQTGINIYLNIIDNKAVVEAAGGYWDYACGVRDRFEIELSTTPCDSSEIGCTSKLLYENLTITPDGDFAEDIQEVSISG